MIYRDLSLNCCRDNMLRTKVTQSEHGAVIFIISLFNGNERIELTDCKEAVYYGTRPDNGLVKNVCKIQDNVVLLPLILEMTAVAGKLTGILEIAFESGNVKFYGVNFEVFALPEGTEILPDEKEEQEKTVSITENGTTEILPDENKVFSKVEVNVNVSGETVFYNEYGKPYIKNPVIPEGVTAIGLSAFEGCKIDTITLPTTLTKINSNAFNVTPLTEIDFSKCQELELVASGALGNSKFTTLDFSKNQMLKTLDNNVCFGSFSLTTVVFPPNLATIGSTAFKDCTALKQMNIPRSVTLIRIGAFERCGSLEFVTIEQGFNCNNLNLSASIKYSVETIMSWADALYDRTGLDPYTLTIGAINIAKLTDEQIAVFTNKNWTLA